MLLINTADLCCLSSFRRFTNFMMARTAGLNILGLVLASWIARTSFAHSFDCGILGQSQTVIASKFYNTTVTSPNYPLNYDNYLDCKLLIKVDNSLSFRGYIVKVIFNDFSLESPCSRDVLTFYYGMDVVSINLLGSYCGGRYPEVIYSAGQYLYVKFHTDSSGTSKGFSFSFSAVKEEEASGICRPPYQSSKVHWLSGSSGTFFTPDYPVPYPDDATCLWIITVPAGKIVKLKFENFDFTTVFSSCKQLTNATVYVQIRDGQYQESVELALRCGYYPSSRPSVVYSTGRYMWVKFYSNSQNSWQQAKGFKAHFEAVDLPPSSKKMCLTVNIYNNNLTLSGTYGTLQSPQDPKYYPPGSSCDWLITVPEGKIVKLKFDRFELKPSSGSICTADYVEILDGKSSYSKSKGKFCGYTKPDDIRSSGRYMWVRFRADHLTYSIYEGFKATFTAEEKPTSLALIIGVTFGVVFLIGLVCCVVCSAKRKKTPSRAAGVGMPMTDRTSASHTAQPLVIQLPPSNPIQQPAAPPPVGYAPAPTIPSSPPPAYPYPSEPPPPYPGEETVPQYPPPGQPYSWSQSAPASEPPQRL